MASGMTKLIDVLIEREASMNEMMRLLEAERATIIGLDTDGLQATAARKAQITALMEELDGTCRQLLVQEGARHGLADTATLSPLIARSANPVREELAGLQAKLSSLAVEIRRMLADNRSLLESSFATIGRSLAFFQNRLKVADTYGYSGQMVERSPGAGIIRKEI